MKLSVAVAGEQALHSAFVVFRGFEQSIIQASTLGYDGVELALKSPEDCDVHAISSLLEEQGMEISCISTGQVSADLGYSFSDEDIQRRRSLISLFREMIDIGQLFHAPVNVGSVRGSIGDRDGEQVETLFMESMQEVGSYAQKRGVTLLIEPVNRYEIDFINSVEEGSQILQKINLPNILLMPDVFHMNIEDRSIEGSLEAYIDQIGYVHLADSNRHAPGWGHLDFRNILTTLKSVGYDGWTSVEVLPVPDPFAAARQAADHILGLMRELDLRT